MNCPQHEVELNELLNGEEKLQVCPDCAGLWIDGSELNGMLLHENLPGIDSLGGRAIPDEPTGTCPTCVIDLAFVEARGQQEPMHYEACPECGSVYLPAEADPPTTYADAKQMLLAFFRKFIARRPGGR